MAVQGNTGRSEAIQQVHLHCCPAAPAPAGCTSYSVWQQGSYELLRPEARPQQAPLGHHAHLKAVSFRRSSSPLCAKWPPNRLVLSSTRLPLVFSSRTCIPQGPAARRGWSGRTVLAVGARHGAADRQRTPPACALLPYAQTNQCFHSMRACEPVREAACMQVAAQQPSSPAAQQSSSPAGQQSSRPADIILAMQKQEALCVGYPWRTLAANFAGSQ